MMHEPPSGYQIVLRTDRRREWRDGRLVLSAVGIQAATLQQDGHWMLIVKEAQAAAAARELAAYQRENREPVAGDVAPTPVYRGGPTAVVVYALVLMLVTTLGAHGVLGGEWLARGRMHAGSVMAGQWWRTFTALTLHLDAGHLASNLIFGTLFGLLAGRLFGGGVAWLIVVVAGALGNFVNAAVQPPAHLSIGASTAVFAALGAIVSHGLRPRTTAQQPRLKRWSPLIAGLVLLAFTGVGGPRTDVAAHVTGFLAGLGIGWGGCQLPARWLARPALQWAAGSAAVGLVVIAWALALSG